MDSEPLPSGSEVEFLKKQLEQLNEDHNIEIGRAHV